MDNPVERRRFVRLNMLTDVEYTKKSAPAEKALSMSKNIGEGGICLIVYEDLRVDDLLDLKIYLAQESLPVEATGRIVWLKEFVVGEPSKGKRFDAGIEFISITESDREKVEKYVFAHTLVRG